MPRSKRLNTASQIELLPLSGCTAPLQPAPPKPPNAIQLQVGDRVSHVRSSLWQGEVVGTPATHPWDCCEGMVLVAVGDDCLERMPTSLLEVVK